MACSRFKTRRGCFLYGKLRRSDFLPVGEELDEEVLERGYESESSDEDDEGGLQHAFGSEDSEEEGMECMDPAEMGGNELADFL